jgi:hypothetical protein
LTEWSYPLLLQPEQACFFFQQFWSPSVTTHSSLPRLKTNKFKFHHLTSQSLQHSLYWCSV